MDGDYTRLEDCDRSFDHASYQIGLKEVPDYDISTAHGSGSTWEWNVYGGEWHLMSGKAETLAGAWALAERYVRDEADAVMHFLMSKGR